jgi:carbamoyl-phosphate synthase small subunit
MNAKLILENGMSFEGKAFGAPVSTSGEVVFNTGMVGYPEALTDPSYYGQILTSTYPLIGNYGVPNESNEDITKCRWESSKIQAFGFIVANLSDVFSHWNADMSLDEWLKKEGIPGITGIDTRALTKVLRESGTMLGKIVVNDQDVEFYDPNKDLLIEKVTVKEPVEHGEGDKTILLMDFGCKNSIIANVVKRGFKVIQVPYHYDYSAISYDGIVLSSGPGDPAQYMFMTDKIKAFMKEKKPILGICLGHQLLALTAGAKTYKLGYGHRSQNQPVIDRLSSRAYVTTQNHGYAVDTRTIPSGWVSWFENLNDGTNEGLWHRNLPILSTQFHPEAMPGPVDTGFIFDEFKRCF